MERAVGCGGDARRVLYAASTFGHLLSFHVPYLNALSARGAEVVALAAGDPAGMPVCVRCVEAPFAKSFTAPGNLAAAAQVARLMREERFDIVLTHTSLAAFFVRLGVALSGCRATTRVVNTVHGYLFDDETPTAKRLVMLGAEKLVAGATDLVVVMNAQDQTIARAHRLCREEPVIVPGMGVDLGRCVPATPGERREARARLGVPDDAFVLLYAAEFSARKSQDVLLRALPRLPERAMLALPGRGARLEECRALARELGVEGRALFPGFAEDMGLWRRASDACVSASRYEGLPFHVVEAMACGLPCVLSRVKGHEDLVGDAGSGAGECGLLYPYGDSAAFAEAVRRLMENPAAGARMGEAAVRRAQAYRLDVAMPQVMACYGF